MASHGIVVEPEEKRVLRIATLRFHLALTYNKKKRKKERKEERKSSEKAEKDNIVNQTDFRSSLNV